VGFETRDEEPGLGAEDGRGGEKLGGGVEFGDEFDEDEGLGEFGGFGRGLVGRDDGAAVGYCGDLCVCGVGFLVCEEREGDCVPSPRG
jgi:hypothetical protein